MLRTRARWEREGSEGLKAKEFAVDSRHCAGNRRVAVGAPLHAVTSNSGSIFRKSRPTRRYAKGETNQGRDIFRFDTFGDAAYWGDTLHLHQAIEGVKLGGVGPGVSPTTALAVGLKVDVDALSPDLVQALQKGQVNLNDPGTTLAF